MRKAISLFVFLFFYLYFSSYVSAIGIAPGKITMDFVPGFEAEFDGTISNSKDVAAEFDVYTGGELAEYLTVLTPDYIVIGPNQVSAYRFRIELPDEFERPGKHKGYVWAGEHVEEPEKGGAIGARLEVATTIEVNVPYPGKYVEMTLKITNPNVNDDVGFDLSVVNRGKENLTGVRCEIEITNAEGERVGMLRSEERPIITTKTETFHMTWFSDVDPGMYGANVTVYYEGETKTLKREFNLGAPLIRITNVTAEPITNGTIGKILTKIKSYWNQDITDVYIELFVSDLDGRIVATDKSESFTVRSFTEPTIRNYWDTSKGVELGDYKGLVVIHYLDKNDTVEFSLEVEAEPGFSLGNEMVIIIIILALLAVLIPLFMFFRRKGRDSKQRKLASFSSTRSETISDIKEEIKKEVERELEAKARKKAKRGGRKKGKKTRRKTI